MNRLWVFALTAVCAVAALGQNGPSYQPVVPAPSTVESYGGYGGYGGGGTVAGSALNGMASVISAKGAITSRLPRPRSI